MHPQHKLSSSGIASLRVGELGPSVSEALLSEIFDIIGPLASVCVCRDPATRRSLGYAYVSYLRPADAKRALDELNHSPIKTQSCRITPVYRDPTLNIFIKNLDEVIDNKDLCDTFAAFGNVVSCKVVTDEDGKSRGYGFVQYEAAESTHAAIKAVNRTFLRDKQVFVGYYLSRKDRQSIYAGSNLIVKNLDYDVDGDKLRATFEAFGTITSCKVMCNGRGVSKGFGYVCFSTPDEAANAITEMNDKMIGLRSLYVSLAQRRDVGRQQLEGPGTSEAPSLSSVADPPRVELAFGGAESPTPEPDSKTELEELRTELNYVKSKRDEIKLERKLFKLERDQARVDSKMYRQERDEAIAKQEAEMKKYRELRKEVACLRAKLEESEQSKEKLKKALEDKTERSEMAMKLAIKSFLTLRGPVSSE